MSKLTNTKNQKMLVVSACILVVALLFVRSAQGTYSLKNGELYSMINNLVSAVIFIAIVVIVVKLLTRRGDD